MRNKYPLYLNAFIYAVNSCQEGAEKDVSKIVLYGVKLINSQPETSDHEYILSSFQVASTIKNFVGELTPAQFMNIFPIDKEFKGEKWETKDYFYTMDYIKTLEVTKPLGDQALVFLTEYTNREIHNFHVKVFSYLSALRQREGHLNIMEEFMASQGMETPNTFKNSKNEALYVRHGKPVKIEQSKPVRLKLIKDAKKA